ncbi:MAG: hypothetical protein HPY83_08490 [Anaerolineae bacterium]|nr:hypothetical protein [Anaerolineae bacterium]
MPSAWREVTIGEHQGLTAETEALSVTILPGVGGKMASFRSRGSGFEYLWQPPDGVYPVPEYGAQYGPEFATGFDECFPTLLACEYPAEPWKGVPIPDHGEVWALPWEWRVVEGALTLAVAGRGLPYRLAKAIQVEGEEVLLRYRLTNLSEEPLRWLWSAHPLFNLTPGLVVHVPGRPAMTVYESLGDALGAPGSLHRWPYAGEVDLALPAERELAAEKVFLSGLGEGRVVLHYTEMGEGVSIQFPQETLTGIGLWYNVRGWPAEAPHHNVGVEPCSEPHESLTDCRNVLAPGGEATWWMRWILFRWAPGRRAR